MKNKILLIEDSISFSQKICDSLTYEGHEVTQAYSLKDARENLALKEFDYILLDLILPDGDGSELLDELSKEIKGKVIVLSGDSDHQRRNHVFESGILDYFSKISSTHKIVDDIKKLLIQIESNVNINILIVDDSSFMRKVLKNILIPKKFNIIEAKEGKEGLEILDKHEIHLVISDYEMPNMNGNEFIEKVKSNLEFLDLPIIMLSGNDDRNVIARALKNGASDFLKKPFATEELLLKCDLHVNNYKNTKIIKDKDKELILSLEKTKKAERHKALFLANMSHEIRTPLNAIMGFVDLLSEEETDDTKKSYLTTIQKSGEMLLNLVDDVLDFSKIDNGKLDINKETFNLKELFNHMVTLYTPMIKEKDILFYSSVDDNVVDYVNSDYLRIKQVLTNLLGNAIKFTPKNGKINFNISFDVSSKLIIFSITDSGIGIAKENHEKVFNLFSQAEKTTTKKFGGTGLGLSICSKLVSLLGGNISLKSELGEGSCFSFTVPVGNIKENVITEEYISVEKKKKNIQVTFDKKVLLAEDNITNQTLMKIIFSKYKLKYDIASDGFEAIEFYKKNDYDMIFMDENMPNMTGSESVSIIREHEKNMKRKYTPIVSLTANATLENQAILQSKEMDEYLFKPLDRNKLFEIFIKYFERETVLDIVEKKSSNQTYDEEFGLKVSQPLLHIENSLAKNDMEKVLKYINIIKIIILKYNYKKLFSLCLNIEQSIKDIDIQSCENFLHIFKEEING